MRSLGGPSMGHMKNLITSACGVTENYHGNANSTHVANGLIFKTMNL